MRIGLILRLTILLIALQSCQLVNVNETSEIDYGNNKSGQYVRVNNVNLYYEIYGKGESLLLLHGGNQSIKSFSDQITEFSRHYRVIALDSRGRGKSSDDKFVPFNYVLQALATKLFLDEIGVKSAHIVGWSDGGIIALIMAIEYPEKVKTIVSMAANIFPHGVIDSEDYIKNTEQLIKSGNGEYNLITKLKVMMSYYPQLKFSDLNAIYHRTLIMAGDRDIIRPMHSVSIFKAIKNAELAIIPGEGHMFPSDNAQEFNRLVMSFLSKN